MNRQGSGGPDYLAPQLMDVLSLYGPNIPGSRLFTAIYLFCTRLHFYLTGRIFPDQMSYFGRKSLGIPFGETAFVQVRTCWFDDCVETFLDRNRNAECNLVILGAGYDTRCYRFALGQQEQQGVVNLFEVDAPATQVAKVQTLTKAGITTGTGAAVTYVACDFEHQDWMEELNKSDKFDAITKPTLFVWEGVTPYLEREVVVATIEKVAQCGKGSCIGFDYFDKGLLTQRMVRAAAKATSEAWKFGLDDDEIGVLLQECNREYVTNASNNKLQVLDHLKSDELIQRYCAKHPDGRSIGFLEDFGGFLLIGSVV